MASGLAALLDDVAAIAKLAAASLDDVAGAAGKAGAKAAGVVVDDAAVAPAYTIGFTPDRELPIVGKIALGSLRNKFLILLPAALLLSALAPWAVTPLLMIGGAYLCYEATEKVCEVFAGGHAVEAQDELALSSSELERSKVRGAIRTDLILSAEIMAIALSTVAGRSLAVQAAALAVVGLLLTLAVYGAVGLLVKMDDIGLHLARRPGRLVRRAGEMLVRAMPKLMDGLGAVGTGAMLWVGGGIILHGLETLRLLPLLEGLDELTHRLAAAPVVGPAAAWLAFAAVSAGAGIVVGALLLACLKAGAGLRRAVG